MIIERLSAGFVDGAARFLKILATRARRCFRLKLSWELPEPLVDDPSIIWSLVLDVLQTYSPTHLPFGVSKGCVVVEHLDGAT